MKLKSNSSGSKDVEDDVNPTHQAEKDCKVCVSWHPQSSLSLHQVVLSSRYPSNPIKVTSHKI